jgi:hypothetical protein
MNKPIKSRPRSERTAAEETKPLVQIELFVPEQPPALASPPPTPTPPAVLAPPPPNDQAKFESPAFLEKVRRDATLWAQECGLKPPFTVNGPERVNFSKGGHGYEVTIKEDSGKQRQGSARFNSKGASTYWSLDGIVTG